MKTEQIAYFDKLIQQKLESLPRAIEGKAPIERLEEICQELRWLKDVTEQLLIHVVVKSFYCYDKTVANAEEDYDFKQCDKQCEKCMQ